MNYTLHQLKIFLKVYECGSITKASEALFLTQPAVSLQLKSLQDQFSVPLTERIGRKIYVTDFGKEIAALSIKILAEAEKLQHTALQYEGLLAGKLNISVVSTGKYVMPYFLSDFVKKHAGIDIRVDVTNRTRVLQSVIDNETDFALVSLLPEDFSVNAVELMENRLYLVGGSDLKFESKNQLSVKDIATLPMIFREQGSATRKAMEEFFSKSNISPRTSLELVSNEAVKQAICAGLGYSIMPLIGMKGELQNGSLKIFKTKGLPIETSWNLIYSTNKNLSPAAKAFLDHINTTKEQVIEKYFINPTMNF